MGNNVSEVLSTVNAQGLTNWAKNLNSIQQNNSESFKNALNNSTGNINTVKNTATNDAKVSKGTTVVENKPVNKIKEADNNVSKSDSSKMVADNKTEAVVETMEGAKDIVSAITEKFSVTEEDVENAMEVLGITMFQLFNQTDLQAVIMNVTGINDSVELLTNVEAYDGMKDVMGFMNELSDIIKGNLNLTDEGFKNLINDKETFKSYFGEDGTDNDEFMSYIPGNEGFEGDSEEIISYIQEPTKELANDTEVKNSKEISETNAEILPVNNDNEVSKENRSDVKVEVNIENDANVNTNNANLTAVQNKGFEEKENHSNSRNDKNNSNPFEFNILGQTNTANTVADVVETVESFSNVADAREIMQQITDYIKVNIRANETSMEMQLHPASLGTVNMQVVSNNGQVTAHFTVQNEAVKAVLETQLLNLQETLNEAGTKVNAIEVTVANYNLDKGADNHANEGNPNENSKGSRRRGINLQGIDSLDDLEALGLDEAEMVEAKVMEMNGNTVNYRA